MTKLPILCYHKVGPVASEGRRLNVEPKLLATHVRYFLRRSYTFVKAGELAELWPPRAVCFTFDDAYLSTMTFGVEVLDRANVKGTFYAVPSLVGKSSTWDKGHEHPLAEWSLLESAQKRSHEIANHTFSHCDLSSLSEADQQQEWESADDALMQHGIAAGSVCYPFGKTNAHTAAAAAACGYKVGLALKKRVATETDERLMLPRIVVAYSDSMAKLLYKMHVRPLLRLRKP